MYLFLKNGPTRPLFHLFLSFQTQIIIFTTNKCEKMSIQYTVLGFKLTTFGTWSPPTTTRPGLPPKMIYLRHLCTYVHSWFGSITPLPRTQILWHVYTYTYTMYATWNVICVEMYGPTGLICSLKGNYQFHCLFNIGRLIGSLIKLQWSVFMFSAKNWNLSDLENSFGNVNNDFNQSSNLPEWSSNKSWRR